MPRRVPAHSRVVLAGDFLAPLADIRACLESFALIPVRLHLVQVLDPAELLLPYEGRVRFIGLEKEGEAWSPASPASAPTTKPRCKRSLPACATSPRRPVSPCRCTAPTTRRSAPCYPCSWPWTPEAPADDDVR